MRKWLFVMIAFSLFWVSVFPPYSAQGASKPVRVALFFESGSSFKSVPTATFISSSGIEVISQQSNKAYFNSPANSPIRISPNQFRVLILETNKASEAQTVTQKLSQLQYPVTILTYKRKGEDIFRIVVGDESTYEKAVALLKSIKDVAGLGKEVIGPYAFNGGVFVTEQEALAQTQALIDAGYDASIAMTMNNSNQAQFMVIVGNEGTEGELAALLQEVGLAFPDLALSPLGEMAYLIVQQDALFMGTQLSSVPHYYFSLNDKVILRPLPEGSIPTVAIEEKANRLYRGQMELSLYNGKMAVINELPLEEYLYAVVGAEMATGWPIESLKTQAVIARTYAIGRGNKYGIANVTDTTYDQAYYGVARESDDVRQAVDATRGEVLTYNGKIIEAFYYSNAGGLTADGREVWGNAVEYLKPVESPDTIPLQTAPIWYRIAREDGSIGYIHSDFITVTPAKNFIGLTYGIVNDSNVNFRTGPSTVHTVVDKLAQGEYVVLLESVPGNNAYSWIEGPIDGLALMTLFNTRASRDVAIPFTLPIEDLKVVERGPSNRVISMLANDLPVPARTPDSLRSLLGGIRSTKFEVEEMGRYTVLGAGGKKTEYPAAKAPLYVVSANNQVTSSINNDKDTFVLYGKGAKLRVVSKIPLFRFRGNGYGHGLGLSQFGARALAEQGYGYKQILAHYYSENVVLQKME